MSWQEVLGLEEGENKSRECFFKDRCLFKLLLLSFHSITGFVYIKVLSEFELTPGKREGGGYTHQVHLKYKRSHFTPAPVSFS